MTAPPEKIAILCPACGRVFEDWKRPSPRLQAGELDQDYLQAPPSIACPACACTVDHSRLVPREDGVLEMCVPKDDITIADL